MNVFCWDLWFYTDYKITVYAADENYASFIQTFEDVQEEDGYFGSAIVDTTSLRITR